MSTYSTQYASSQLNVTSLSAISPPPYSPSISSETSSNSNSQKYSSSSSTSSKSNKKPLSSFEQIWGNQMNRDESKIWGTSVGRNLPIPYNQHSSYSSSHSQSQPIISTKTSTRLVKDEKRRSSENVWFSSWRRNQSDRTDRIKKELKLNSPWGHAWMGFSFDIIVILFVVLQLEVVKNLIFEVKPKNISFPSEYMFDQEKGKKQVFKTGRHQFEESKKIILTFPTLTKEKKI